MKPTISIGVDIGGSHISCAAVDTEKREIISGSFFENEVDNHAPPETIIKTWGETIMKTIDCVGWDRIRGIGFAMPGPFDYENGISLFSGETHKYEKTYGLNVKEALKDFLKSPAVEIRFVNDAAAFAIGEAWTGKASDKSKSVAITVGTGLGSGFIENGFPVTNGENVPKDGFIWDLPFNDSVADDFFSTRGIVNAYYSLTGKMVNGAKDVALAAENNNSDAQSVFHEFGEGLANLLTPWLKKFDAEILVVGGSISKAFHFFEPAMTAAFKSNNCSVIIRKSELNDKAQIFGSTRLLDDHFWERV